MKNRFLKGLVASLALAASGFANAGLITEYDFTNATGTSVAATNTESGFLASLLSLTNAQNTTGAFNSHFYHNFWDTTKNVNKYYSFTLSNLTDNFDIERMTFSLEDTTAGANSWFLSSSLDNFQSTLSSGVIGTLNQGEVVPFDISFNNLVTTNNSIEFRFYMTGQNTSERVGFANHTWGDENHPNEGDLHYGYEELSIYGSVVDVPEPSTLAIFVLSIMGLASRKFKKQA